MNILPKLRTKYGENVGVEILITPPELIDNNKTFVSTDAASGVSSFAVDNGLKFSVGQYALVGAFGAEKSEIQRIHASTTPTAVLLTLASTTNFAHNRGESITYIPYNQIVIERSTDGGANYSVLTTLNIRADSTETYYQDSTGTSAYYYRAKFSNSVTSDVSQYSDGIIGTGYTESSAGAIIRAAMASLGDEFDDVITKEFTWQALSEGRNELDMMPGIERWSFRTSFDYAASQCIPGQYRVALPATMRESSTFKNLLAVRIGRNRYPLGKQDKQALDRWYWGVARNTLLSAITSGSVTLPLTGSGDFDESGAVNIASEDVSHEIDAVDYTSNNPATNVLSGATNIADSHSAGAMVWQGVSFGTPAEYTVDAGYIIFSQPFSNDIAGQNIWLDFYRKITAINSDGDLLDEPNYQMYIPYLRYRLRKKRDSSIVRDNDDDWKAWVEKRDGAVQKEYLGQDVRLHVDIPI